MPTLEWIGKDKVVNHHLEVPYKVLEHQYTYIGGGKQGEEAADDNKIIRGDNLEALKALLPQYEGRIKCIYIDPPYNTGNEGWVYNDNVNDPKIKNWLGDTVGKEGEDLCRHDKWLCMMYPRLKLLQRLLSDDGAIFISIDDTEQATLKMLCDEVFGSRNFINTIVWQKKFSRSNDAIYFSEQHDYILLYAKNKPLWKRNLLLQSDELLLRYKNPDNDPRGPWQSVSYNCNKNAVERPNLYYPITNPVTGKEIWPSKSRVWAYSRERHEENMKNNLVYWGTDGKGLPRRKQFVDSVMGVVPTTWWEHLFAGENQTARKELRKIFDNTESDFQTPKPKLLIERILQIASDTDSIILDSFAGSGTTAHAVLSMNKADGGNRKFILVEMMDYAETITAERVRRVIDGYASVEGTSGSFGFYELGEPLLYDDHNLNENIPIEKIRQYVYFMETKKPMDLSSKDEPYLLGCHVNSAYYFYYEKERITTLNYEFLSTVKIKAEGYVMYADLCTLSDKELQEHHITFKKIPRDISRL